MTTGLIVLAVALVVATGAGLLKRRYDGWFRGAAKAEEPEKAQAETLSAQDLDGHELGERATLLQFSSAFCAPCRATRQTLQSVAKIVPGVVHVELDAEHHLDLVNRLNVMRTPTTLVLNAAGQVVARASGAPRREAVLAALGEAVEPLT
ncbi:TlpA family protein disulfide reductase [Tenggerimyces flavus]|uniref:TlpA family protein disulfide reductase n=1 Tax=Tenggerimyces flavus TaxID=1708749 RepID=A0ABV7YN68_9ACTN|nr:thioredoxin family protein [Tenggerimyces flavus]MBM7783860.1 thiol-disulfide isomerase/thioredoxin [Tenggerimyces flavus]